VENRLNIENRQDLSPPDTPAIKDYGSGAPQRKKAPLRRLFCTDVEKTGFHTRSPFFDAATLQVCVEMRGRSIGLG
jgi:hypothetical protein